MRWDGVTRLYDRTKVNDVARKDEMRAARCEL